MKRLRTWILAVIGILADIPRQYPLLESARES